MAKRGRRNDYKKGDRFTVAAKEQGFKARSVFKLQEADKRFRVFQSGQRVLDLGACPGSWTQYALQRVGRSGTVVAIDIQEMTVPGAVIVHDSIFDVPSQTLLEALGGPADIALSDMAPNTTGVAFTDHVRQLELARCALDRACDVLAPGGHFFVKVFDGEEVPDFQDAVRARFGKVKRMRPEAVRQNSREFFLLAMGFRGRVEEP